ncbi:MAG: hypothetical protein U9Q20_08385 [Campylobacterota bacterium]|nr:hypothetical protein [Campylobacterota bacterium]
MKKYIGIFVSVFILTLIGNSIYEEMTKDETPGKAKRLECQKSVTTFERGFSNDDIKTAQDLLKSGNVVFSSTIEKAIYAQSKLFEFIKLEDTDKIVQQELNKYIVKKDPQDEKMNLSYNIYENDIKDPGKKTKKSKLYAGYVVFQVKNKNNKLIYKVQIDFMDKKGADIANSIKCSIKSFVTYNK